MAGGICYSIDTSALINWWVEDYSPDVFPGLLPKMEDLIGQDRLRAARSVKDELATGDLRTWCLAQPDLFVDEDEEIQKRVAGLMAAYQNPKKTRGIDQADPFVVALADMNGWHVVSAERGGSLENNPNIPTVCNAMGVQHIRFFEMLRGEGWKL
ncbi:MAG: DUF4411 family protein [Proteobacteria bacterium]|nr:DUF4411 family protein [Pseudomonadota bacterium]